MTHSKWSHCRGAGASVTDHTIRHRAIFQSENLWETARLTRWVLGDLYRSQSASTTQIAKPKTTRTQVAEESRCQSWSAGTHRKSLEFKTSWQPPKAQTQGTI